MADEVDSGAVHPLGFDDFYRERRDRLYRALAMTLGNRNLAIEAVDEAMTRGLERWSDVATYENPAGWVYRVAYNWATSSLRKRRREVSTEPREQAFYDAPATDPALLSAVGRLSVERRAVVVMRYFLDWSTDQIAAALEVAPGTVKSRAHRALRQLEEDLAVSSAGSDQ